METAIFQSFAEHKRRYGIRRLVAELKGKGMEVGKYKGVKGLHQHALKAIQSRSFVPRTTDSCHPYPISPNLLLEHDTITKPRMKDG